MQVNRLATSVAGRPAVHTHRRLPTWLAASSAARSLPSSACEAALAFPTAWSTIRWAACCDRPAWRWTGCASGAVCCVSCEGAAGTAANGAGPSSTAMTAACAQVQSVGCSKGVAQRHARSTASKQHCQLHESCRLSCKVSLPAS